MNSAAPVIDPGFVDPVAGSQATFRALLDAMAMPGLVHDIPADALGTPRGLGVAAGAILLTTTDFETPVWISPSLRSDRLRQWIALHCGARIVETRAEARFALLDCADVTIGEFQIGEDRYPDRSATLIIVCPSLEGGRTVTLSGPGVESARSFAPAGLTPAFWQEAIRNNSLFPLGVDFIFASGSKFAAIPRSTRLSVQGSV